MTDKPESTGMEGQLPTAPATRAAKFKAVLKEALQVARKVGIGAAELIKKLKKDKSPDAMLKTVEASLDANQKRSADMADRMEKLYNEVAKKKTAYEKAPPARKRILEQELRTKLANYKALESEYGVLLDNERVLAGVKGRIHEVVAYGMAGVSEEQIDDIIDEIEQSVEEAEGRGAASRDLEKAGMRRERESDTESFLEQLSGFEEETPSPSVEEAAAKVGETEKPSTLEHKERDKKKEAEEER